MNVGPAVSGQTLEDGAVLGVDRQELHAAGPRRRGHQAAGHHQSFLVGERDGPPGLNRGHGRQKSGAADERGDDDVGLDVAGQRHEPVRTSEKLRTRRRQETRELVASVRFQERDGARRILLAHVRDPLDVRPAGGEPRHRELLGEARHHVEGSQTDRSSRTEQRNAFHARHQA